MKQITLRGVPENVKKTVKKEAERKGMSLNKAIISLLERAVGGQAPEKKKKPLYHDLDHLTGLWSREEAAVFDKSLKIQRDVARNSEAMRPRKRRTSAHSQRKIA